MENRRGKSPDRKKKTGGASGARGKSEGSAGKSRKSKPVFKKKKAQALPKFTDEVRLNKYIANTGICSRREADVLIETGVVSVNGEIITEMGYKVKPGDVVKYDGQSIKPDTKRYVLVNKPKGFVTTNNDPWGRKSLFGLIDKACKEQIVPFDNLSRDEVGLILFSNDNDMILKITHPTSTINQLFHITLNKSLQEEHRELITSTGVFVGSKKILFEELTIIENKGGNEVGVRINSSNTKSVHRVFEKLGYEVVFLDRLEYGSLTKKDLPRGQYRHLSEKEVSFLKMI